MQGEVRSRAQLRELDLGSLESVARFTQRVLAEESHVDALVLNAGVALLPYSKTIDGLETHFAVNHLGHFALTLPLVPISTRVVVTTSGAANQAAETAIDELADRDEGKDYDGMQVYAESKLATYFSRGGLKLALVSKHTPNGNGSQRHSSGLEFSDGCLRSLSSVEPQQFAQIDPSAISGHLSGSAQVDEMK